MADWNVTNSRQDCEVLRTDLLSQRELIIAANWGPVVFDRTEDGSLHYRRVAGGLVTALVSVCKFTDATWIACAQTDADAAWRKGDIPLDSGHRVRVRFLSPEAAAYEGYSNLIASPLLWFLQHSMWDVPRTPVINRATWRAWGDGYISVNRLFAQAIARQVRAMDRPSLVWL